MGALGLCDAVSVDVGKVDILGNDKPKFIDRLVGKSLLKTFKVGAIYLGKVQTAAMGDQGKVIKIDVDKNPQLAEALRVKGLVSH